MNISAISFCAANTSNLKQLANKVNRIGYTQYAHHSIIDDFISGLGEAPPSKETFVMSVDALEKCTAIQKTPMLQYKFLNLALDIATKAQDVTKKDVLDSFYTLARAEHSINVYV